jgi:hypothetical protein
MSTKGIVRSRIRSDQFIYKIQYQTKCDLSDYKINTCFGRMGQGNSFFYGRCLGYVPQKPNISRLHVYLQFLQAENCKYTLELWIYPISVIFSGGIFSISVGGIRIFERVDFLQIRSRYPIFGIKVWDTIFRKF